MKNSLRALLMAPGAIFAAFLLHKTAVAGDVPAHLPGELSADEVLDGAYPFPPSPAVEAHEDADGLDQSRLSKPPAPGVHPRILISPDDLPGLRQRIKETEAGRKLYDNMERRIRMALKDPAEWTSNLYDRLAAGDKAGAEQLLKAHNGLPPDIGHYQPWLCGIVMEAFDALITEDAQRGAKAGAALATYCEIMKPDIDKSLDAPMNDDIWRARIGGPVTGFGSSSQGFRGAIGGHVIGYGYDFAYNFMTDAQRDSVRGLISEVTKGRLWMGGRLPHHFRNWNWIAVGLQQPLLSLSIEGEKGYDPRVYKLGVQIARDYLTYGISPQGMSTEAVGYTQFGLNWATPFIVAASRRGDNLLAQSHFRRMVDWYLQCMEPGMDHWSSHGDGGDAGPSLMTVSLWHYFYPADGKADFLRQCFIGSMHGMAFDDKSPLFEAILWASEGIKDAHGNPVEYRDGASLGLPDKFFDTTRSSLNARTGWNKDASMLEFECRTDSVGGSHEHADRGVFTFAALGRLWAKYNFRSVETRHHNGVLIDGAGQGFWPGPGKWLGLEEKGNKLIAACDAKDAYDWWWPKEINTEPASFIRYKYPRWQDFGVMSAEFHKNYGDGSFERDPRPSVVAHWKGFEQTDPRMWDEDTWPVRLPHNPVRRAFRTVVFSRGDRPYLLVVDDIQKDDKERLYEWLMQTGLNTDVATMSSNDIVLCDGTVPRDETGRPRPAHGDRELLVRILDMSDPAQAHDYSSRPSIRLDTFERKDTLLPEDKHGGLSGSRSFGLDKRLVIASRSVAPNFKILLFPMHAGEALPVTTWNEDRTRLKIQAGTQTDEYTVGRSPEGRTLIEPAE